MRTAAAILVLGASACVEAPDTTVVDRGRGCAYAWPSFWDERSTDSELNDPDVLPRPPYDYAKRAFAAEQPVLVWVGTSASACATDLQGSCAIDLRGDTLVFTSRLSWNEPDRPCLTREAPPMVYALCKSPVLGAGTYQVQLGEAHAAFTVPDDPSLDPCFDADRD